MFNTFFRKNLIFSYGLDSAARKLLAAVFLTILSTHPAQAEDTFTILAFGDSLTRGYGLPENQGLVPQLQNWLLANGGEHMSVINAGLSGDTTAGGLARIDWSLTSDIDAVIVALGGNDMLRGIYPASSHQNLDGIVSILKDRGLPVLLVGLPAPTNFGVQFKTEFDAMYGAVALKHETLLYPFFFQGFGVDQSTAAMAPWMQHDGLHPTAQGVSLIVTDMGPMVLQLARDF
ncbi:MAG: arylesterase [Paracoccaceae bacterium]